MTGRELAWLAARCVAPTGCRRSWTASRVIVVADGSKVGRVHLARICALQDIDEFITDASADPAALAAISATGVTVTVATSDSR